MAISFATTIATHRKRIETLETQVERIRHLGGIQYAPLYEIMWREAEVEDLQLHQAAQDYFSTCGLPLVPGDMRALVKHGLEMYQYRIDDLRVRVPKGSVHQTAEQQTALNEIETAYRELYRVLKREYAHEPEKIPGFLNTICNAISWWNDGHGMRCEYCGAVRRIIPKVLPEIGCVPYGTYVHDLYQLEDHRMGTEKTDHGRSYTLHFSCRLRDPNNHAVAFGGTPLTEAAIQHLKSRMAALQEEIDLLASFNNPMYTASIQEKKSQIQQIQNELRSNPNQILYTRIFEILNAHPLGHIFCWRTDLWKYIPIPSSEPTPPTPPAFENYLSRKRTVRPEAEL